MQIIVKADNGKQKATYIYTAKEHGNNSGYGGGQYISIECDCMPAMYVDCRYMIGYNLKDAAINELEAYYGKNLVSIEVKE